MNFIVKAAVAAGLVVGLASPGLAASKPKPSSAADPKAIHKMIAGKTWDWSAGGAFWAKDGSFQAIFNEAVAEGTWYVTTSGQLCYDAIWYWRDADNTAGTTPRKLCWQHVLDQDGTLWQRNHEKEDWYKVDAAKYARGNKIRRDVRKRLAALR